MPVPTEWQAALDACGTTPDFTLLAALADWFDDHDQPTEAEGVRWLVRVQTWPTAVLHKGYSEFMWNYGSLPYVIACRLTYIVGERAEFLTVRAAFNRFLIAWESLTDASKNTVQSWRRDRPLIS